MTKEATLGAGCFWCIEACYKELNGVIRVEPGYSGGKTDNPTYKEICTGNTGHAEVARVVYDDALVSCEMCVGVCWLFPPHPELARRKKEVDPKKFPRGFGWCGVEKKQNPL